MRSDLVNITQHVKVKPWAQHPSAADPIQGQGDSTLGSLRAGPRSTGAGWGGLMAQAARRVPRHLCARTKDLRLYRSLIL